jgi:hypothetical protein
MLTLSTARILIISKNQTDEDFLRDFFAHLKDCQEPTYKIGKVAPTDQYDFLIFNAISSPIVPHIQAFTEIPDEEQAHFQLLRSYLDKTSKYVLFYGKFYFDLNQERCPSANSKFTLYARMRELVDFINNYKAE